MTLDLHAPRALAGLAPAFRPAAYGLRVVTPAPRDVWRRLLADDPDGLVTQSPEWADAVGGAGWKDASRLYETASGATLVLPLLRRSGMGPGRLAPRASMPGALVGARRAAAADIAAVIDDLAADPAVLIALRPNPLHAGLWQPATRRGA